MRILPLVFVVACDVLPCPALNRIRDDHEAVGGTTAAELFAVAREATGPVVVEWRDGTWTTLEVTLEPQLGTGQLAQRRDCVDRCFSSSQLTLGCPPDALRLDLNGTVRTADGRLDERFVGTLTGRGSDDGSTVEWNSYAAIPLETLVGSLEPATFPDAGSQEGEMSVIVWLDGLGGVLASASVGVETIDEDSVGVGTLGGTPQEP